MGWWWNSIASKAPTQRETPPDSDVIPAIAAQPLQTASIKQEQSKPQLSREDQSDQEFIAWLKDIQAETEERKAEEKRVALISPTSTTLSAPTSAPDDISPDSTYPSEINCRSAFDYAFFCQSFGGQFVNVYRYGSFRSCSNHWQDFWLCMRSRNWPERERAKAVQDHYRKKAVKYKTGPSSEDVWEIRTEPVRDPFQGNLEELEKQIEEWRKENPQPSASWLKTT